MQRRNLRSELLLARGACRGVASGRLYPGLPARTTHAHPWSAARARSRRAPTTWPVVRDAHVSSDAILASALLLFILGAILAVILPRSGTVIYATCICAVLGSAAALSAGLLVLAGATSGGIFLPSALPFGPL